MVDWNQLFALDERDKLVTSARAFVIFVSIITALALAGAAFARATRANDRIDEMNRD